MRRPFAWRSAAVVLGLSVWCVPAWALLPPLPSASDTSAVQVEGRVSAIAHVDRDMGPDPQDPISVLRSTGQHIPFVPSERHRVERTFDLTVKIEKTVRARNHAAPRPPRGPFVVIHGAQLFGPWPWGGVHRIDQVVVGTRARFYLKQRDDGRWFIVEPNGLILPNRR